MYGAVAASGLLFHASDDILHKDYPHIDHHADGDGDARQGYDVGLNAYQLHHNECREHGQGKHGTDDDRSTQVDDEYQHHDDADHDFVQQGIFEGADGLLDELCAVVERHHRHLRGAAVGKLLFGQTCRKDVDLLLHIGDHLHRIAAVTSHDNASHGFLAHLVKASAAVSWSKRHVRHVLDLDRHAAHRCDGSLLDVLQRLHIAQSAYDVFGLVDLHGARAHVDVRVEYGQHRLI